MLRRNGYQRPEFAEDIVRKPSLMINTNLLKYDIFGEMKAPLLRCFLLLSKLKARKKTTEQYRHCYQTFSNLQFRPLLKTSFHSIHIDWRNTISENAHSSCRYHSSCFDVLEKLPTFSFNKKDITSWLLHDK